MNFLVRSASESYMNKLYIVLNTGGNATLHELRGEEMVLALASLGKKSSFVRLRAGAYLVLRTESPELSTEEVA